MRIKNLFILLIITSVITACNNTGSETAKSKAADVEQPETIAVVNFEELQPLLNKSNDTTYVINFWATWCKPCIEEMPAFTKLDSIYRNEKVELILVSLDFAKNLEDQVIPFVEKNNIRSKVVLLNDPDANSWINKVDSSWTGSIPATLIYNNNSRDFYEKTFTFKELEEIVKSKL